MRKETPEDVAADFVAKNEPALRALVTGEGPEPRREFLLHHCVDEDTYTAKPGLPAVYLSVRANDDPAAYDIVLELLERGPQPCPLEALRDKMFAGTLVRPVPMGRPPKMGRDVVVWMTVTVILERFPDLPFSSNDENHDARPVVRVALEALEAAGLEVIEYRQKSNEVAEWRTAERAYTRMLKSRRFQELFWPRHLSHDFLSSDQLLLGHPQDDLGATDETGTDNDSS